MPFNKKISGVQNEKEFVEYFNNKKVGDFDFSTIEFLEMLFENITSDSLIECWDVAGNSKVDIQIKIGSEVKNISIKKGVKNEVHVETIDNFIELLEKLNINENTLIEIKRYLYADGTTDGSGSFRQSVLEYKESNQKIIDEINMELNRNEVIEVAIDRFLLKGRISSMQVDSIIYGVTDDFIWITKDEIENVILSKIDDYSTALHFGPLTLQTWDRNLKRNPKYENRRKYIQIKWYNLSDDIIEVMSHRR